MTVDTKEPMLQTWLAEQYSSEYADGRRCDELQYLQCKLILKPDRFTSAHVFREYAALVQRESVLTSKEIAILGPVVVVLWLVRVKALAGLAPEVSGRHHPAQ